MSTSNRRDFLKTLGIAAATLPFAGGLASRALAAQAKKAEKPKDVPLPKDAKAVDSKDPLASALGYVDWAGDADKKRFPQFKEGQFCKNCSFYTAANEGWGKCTIIATGLVNANGWCGSYQPKPKA